jgi:hypothetical protein
MQRDRAVGGGLLAALDAGPLPEDRARAFAADLTQLGIECGIDVQESVAFLVPAAAGAEARLADPEVRQAVLAMGRARGFLRVALIVGDD